MGSTIANNTANNGGGINTFTQGGANSTATTTLRNSIIAGNSPNNLATAASGGAATFETLGFNLSDNFNSVFTPLGTDITSATPRLGPLSLGGGTTPTHALLHGSPGINAGDASGSTTDQRGQPRIFGASADIGAVEMRSLVVTNTDDGGGGSLRAAIGASNLNGPGLEDIVFDNSVFSTPQIINLLSALPQITGSVTINGTGAHLLTVRRDYNATTDFRIFNIAGGVANGVAISGMTITGGNAGNAGNVDFGGGILSLSALTLTNVHVTGNQAPQAGGVALRSADGNFTGSTFSGNVASFTGGGIFYQGDGNRTLRMVDCTVSGNRAGFAGGIENLSTTGGGNSRLEVVSSTIANNIAPFVGGIETFTSGSGTSATTTLRNSIIANNSPSNLGTGTESGGGPAVLQTLGFNLSDNFNGVFTPLGTDVTSATPRLGPLSLGGGTTPTHALLGGSPGINAGNASGSTADQRGQPRIFGASADMGAVEMHSLVVTNTSDVGAGSLRQALTDANANGGGLDDIIFGPSLTRRR